MKRTDQARGLRGAVHPAASDARFVPGRLRSLSRVRGRISNLDPGYVAATIKVNRYLFRQS